MMHLHIHDILRPGRDLNGAECLMFTMYFSDCSLSAPLRSLDRRASDYDYKIKRHLPRDDKKLRIQSSNPLIL